VQVLMNHAVSYCVSSYSAAMNEINSRQHWLKRSCATRFDVVAETMIDTAAKHALP